MNLKNFVLRFFVLIVLCSFYNLNCVDINANENLTKLKELSDASIFVQSKQYDKAWPILEKFDGSEFENKVWNASALYMKGVCRWNLEVGQPGLEEMEKGADILMTLPDSAYKEKNGITVIFLETAAYELLKGRYQESIGYGRKYLDLMQSLKNSDAVIQENYLLALKNLFMSHTALNQFEEIFSYTPYYKDIIPLTDKNKGYLLDLMVQLGDMSLALGSIEGAIAVYNACLIVIKEVEASEDIANAVKFKLANALLSAGKINEAKDIYEDLMAAAEKSDNPTFKATIILGYVGLKQELGNEAEALDILNKYLPELEEKMKEPEDRKVLYTILYYLQKANGLDEEAKSVYDAYLNDELQVAPAFALQEQKLQIIVNIRAGKMAESRADIDAFKKQAEAAGDHHSQEYGSYLELEIFYSIMNGKNVDKQIADDYLRFLVANYSPKSKYFSTGLEQLIVASSFDEDKFYFSNYLQLYYDAVHDMLAIGFFCMNKKERELYWEKIKPILTGTIPRLIANTNDEKANLAGYQLALLTKGFLLRSEISANDIFANGKKRQSYLDELAERTEYVRGRLLSGDNPGEEKMSDDEMILTLWNESPLYADFYNKISVDVAKIRDAMNEDDLCVEFLWIPNANGGNFLTAYLLRKDWETPKIVNLFTSENYEVIKKEDSYKNPLLSMVIWKSLAPYAEGIRNIYFAPDGPLHEIAIESIPDFEKPGTLISDRWNLYRLSSTRELPYRDKASTGVAESGLFGGMLYDEPEEELQKEYLTANIVQTGIDNNADTTRDFLLTEDDLENMELRAGAKYLPATLSEVKEISKLFSSSKIDNQIFSGTKASEKNFKSLSGKNIPIIHLATHGFYWKKNSKQSRIMEKQAETDSLGVVSDEELALRRTGLLFSGANSALKGKSYSKNSDDGILTAQEISHLRLDNVDLMVLSACETGLGDISADGVFGLQRGFKKAGVGSILMSLWKVDDKATQLLMTKFYEEYLSGKSKRESLLAAQKYLREYEVEVPMDSYIQSSPGNASTAAGIEGEALMPVIKERPYENPKYWAAFILLDGLN